MRPGWLDVPAADPVGRRSSHQAVRLLVFVSEREAACADWQGATPQPGDLSLAGIAPAPGCAPPFLTHEMLYLTGPGSTAARTDPRHCTPLDIHRLDLALSAGRHAVERAKLAGIGLVTARGLGSGGLDSALALACAMSGADTQASWASVAADRLDGEDLPDLESVRATLMHHAGHLDDPYEALRRLGEMELAALVGTCLACAQLGVSFRPLGYPAEVAALAARRLHPGIGPWICAVPEFGNRSARSAKAAVGPQGESRSPLRAQNA